MQSHIPHHMTQPNPQPAAPGYPYGTRRSWTPAFWQRASLPRKVLYVGGAGAALGGTIWLWRWLVKPRPFESVSPQCNDFALADRREINDAIRPMVRDAARRGGVDPFGITTAFVRRYAPDCRTYPEAVRNPGEAQLYLKSFEEVLRIMSEDRLVSPEQRAYFLEMVTVWGRSQGVPASDLPGPMPKPGGLGGPEGSPEGEPGPVADFPDFQ